jgi:acyl carrier protein
MNISSRTPEGTPNECPVCQKELCIEPSTTFGDAPCPHCGTLLWFINLREGMRLFASEDISLAKRELIEKLESLRLSHDSLVWVELVMELEESGTEIAKEDLEKMKTIDDLIDYVLHNLPD